MFPSRPHRLRPVQFLPIVSLSVLFSVGWFALALYFLDVFRRADDVRFKANRVRIDLLEARRREKDFLLRSLTNPDFYRTGSTSYLVLYREAMISLRREIDELSAMLPAAQADEVGKLRVAVQDYDANYEALVAAYRRRGFDDWGLEGNYRKSARLLEESLAQAGNTTLQQEFLELRQDEQDLLRHGEFARLQEHLARLRTRIDKLVPEQSPSLLAHVDHYQQDLEAYRRIQEELGLHEDAGLMGKYREAAHAIEPVAEGIHLEQLSVQEEASRRLTVGLLLAFVLLFVLLTATFSLTAAARSRSRDLEEGNEVLRTQSKELAQLNLTLEESIAERKRSEELLRFVAAGVSSGAGRGFFPALMQCLAEGLGADYALMGELLPNNPERVRTIAVFANGKNADDFEYDLLDTPCANVVGQQLCVYPERIQQQFSRDAMLAEMGVEAYAGMPLFESRGVPLGLLAVLFRRPLQQPEVVSSMLRICGARAAVELERLRAEDALERNNQILRSRSAELAQVNNDLRAASAELTRSNAELQQFAYVASHDLQEPLRAVAGCVQLLQERLQGKLDAQDNQLILHVVDGATRMQALIDDLLALSRVGTGGRPFADTDLNLVLKDVRANLQVAIQQSGATLTHDAMPTIAADQVQMTQLFQNLIANGMKFRRSAAPRIHVGASRKDEEWLFTVKDDGIGIERQYFERIFLLFQRLHTRREYPGTGIGLTICKKIVERHGGRIWIESVPGEGSTFFFTVPDRVSS